METTYIIGQKVKVLIPNPQTNQNEWRDGIVEGDRMIHPSYGAGFKPYPMVFVNTTRTYWKTRQWNEETREFEGDFYDKECYSGFFENEIKL